MFNISILDIFVNPFFKKLTNRIHLGILNLSCSLMKQETELKELRVKYGYTQQDIADVLGVTKATISKYENGQRRMHLKTMKDLSNFFQVDIKFFFDRQPDPESKAKFNDTIDEMILDERKHWEKILLTEPVKKLTPLLDQLNKEGQKKAIERVEELTEIPKYQR